MNFKFFNIFFSESFKWLLCVNNVFDIVDFSNCKYNYVCCNCVCKEFKLMYIFVIFKFVCCLNVIIILFLILYF